VADAVNRHSLSIVETSVLVVDDDSAKRYALGRMLSSRGFRVTEAATAAEALRSASAQQPDVVLLDVKLPDLSGFEACGRIKSDPATASIPVLLVSAVFTDVLHHVHGLNRGADAYLTGDVEPEVLLATVRSLARMRHSERELRAREQGYHSLIAATASIVWSADAGGNAMEPQPSWEPFTGQSAAQHASSSGYACIHPDDRDRVAMEWHQAVARGHLFETGFRLWHAPASEYRHVVSRGAPVTNDDGSVREWIGTITDIHERKNLERTQAQLAAIVEGSTDAIIGTGTDDTITSWNAAAERLYGYTAAEVLGRPRTLLVPPDRMDELAQMLARLRRGELIEDYETVRVRKDGKLLHVALTLSSIRDEAGHFAGTSVITRDITARKQAEEALRRSRQQLQVALEGAGLELWTCDAATGVVQLSDQTATAMNLDPAAPAALWADRIHPADRDRVDADLRAALQGAAEYNVEYRVIDRDGSTRWISSHGKLLRDESGHPLQLVAANQDVTARRLAEEAVRESEEQFRTLANSIPQLAWITDETGFIYWYNERWYEYTGATPEQMKGWGWKSVHDPAECPG
jgi:PAS domain S-box-containing protein